MSNRSQLLLAMVAALGVVAGLIVLSQRSGEETGAERSILAAAPAAAALRGLPQDGVTLGAADAPVTVEEYADLQCPACASFAGDHLAGLIRSHVRGGEVRVVFRNLVILGPDSDLAARAVLAAAREDRAWQFIVTFYANQGAEGTGYVTEGFLRSVARRAGLDTAAFTAALDSAAFDRPLAADQARAAGLGFSSTPSFAVRGPGGREAVVGVSADDVERAIRSVARR